MQHDFSPHPNENPAEYAARLESQYPDVYRQLMPYIIQAAQEIENPDDLTEEEIDAIAYQAALDSGFLRQTPDSHNEESIIDLAKALLFLVLYNQFDADSGPHYQPVMLPYAFAPYWHPGFYPFFSLGLYLTAVLEADRTADRTAGRTTDPAAAGPEAAGPAVAGRAVECRAAGDLAVEDPVAAGHVKYH